MKYMKLAFNKVSDLFSVVIKLSRMFWLFITYLVLFILPIKCCHWFIEISFSILILKSRSRVCTTVDMVKFFKLVNNDYNSHIVSLPNYTLNFMWSDVMLNKTYSFETGEHSLMDVMRSRQLLSVNIERFIDILLKRLPFLMRVKLGLDSETRRDVLRREIKTCLNRKFEHQMA